MREQYGDDFCVVEHDCAALVNGAFLGIPGNGRRVTFRMLHVWDFKDNAINREQIWLDATPSPPSSRRRNNPPIARVGESGGAPDVHRRAGFG